MQLKVWREYGVPNYDYNNHQNYNNFNPDQNLMKLKQILLIEPEVEGRQETKDNLLWFMPT